MTEDDKDGFVVDAGTLRLLKKETILKDIGIGCTPALHNLEY